MRRRKSARSAQGVEVVVPRDMGDLSLRGWPAVAATAFASQFMAVSASALACWPASGVRSPVAQSARGGGSEVRGYV